MRTADYIRHLTAEEPPNNPQARQIVKLMDKIENALSPNLLLPKWRDRLKPEDHPLTGFCYLVTEALWYLLPKKQGWKPKRLVTESGIEHWFLYNPRTDEIL